MLSARAETWDDSTGVQPMSTYVVPESRKAVTKVLMLSTCPTTWTGVCSKHNETYSVEVKRPQPSWNSCSILAPIFGVFRSTSLKGPYDLTEHICSVVISGKHRMYFTFWEWLLHLDSPSGRAADRLILSYLSYLIQP